MGIFLVGAYQDTLGDKHNLFGKTHAVTINYDESKKDFIFQDIEKGDTISDILKEVNFDSKKLICSYSKQISNANLTEKEKISFLKTLEEAMENYTYLSHRVIDVT